MKSVGMSKFFCKAHGADAGHYHVQSPIYGRNLRISTCSSDNFIIFALRKNTQSTA